MKEKQKTTVAIIGLGNIGLALSKNFIKGNRAIIVADRDSSKTKKISDELGHLAQPATIEEAIESADTIIFSVWLEVTKSLLEEHKVSLKGKIIIDPSNPIAPDGKGGFIKTIGKDESSGEMLLNILPDGAFLVKAFGSLSADSLSTKAHQMHKPIVMFYATNTAEIKAKIESLIIEQGFHPFYIGKMNQSIKMEVFGSLHEFGGLGKAINIDELKNVEID